MKVHVLKKLVPPSVCVYKCVHIHTCTNLHKQLMLTKFSTYLVHVPLVPTVVGVGAFVLDLQELT